MTREDLITTIRLFLDATWLDNREEIAEKLLAEYEQKIRAEVIEEYRKEMHDMIDGDDEFTDWQKYEFLMCNEVVAEELKEKKNG